MKEKILITGGAGFIGTHLIKRLIRDNYELIIYDNLSPQVHGENKPVPKWIKENAEFIKADIRDRETLRDAVLRSDKIIHLASETGVGQSMYEIERYTDVIIQGTSVLWDILVNEKNHVNKVVLSSSRAVYGEGKYKCHYCGDVYPDARKPEDLYKGIWEDKCPICGRVLTVVATDEKSLLKPVSIYAVSKKTQEEICLLTGKAVNIPVSVLRYQNVYGPFQSLRNPYTGILSVFTSRLRSGKSIEIYEDGMESRDFVHVEDVVDGTVLALENINSDNKVFNIGNGERTTVKQLAEMLTKNINPELKPIVTGKYRIGDIRHCYADIGKAKSMLGYEPKYNIEMGVNDFLEWALTEESRDFSDNAENELKRKGMLM